MSIYLPKLQKIINEFNHFKERFIENKKCIFTDKVIFTKKNIEEYRKQIIVGFDDSNSSSISKYRDQINKGLKNSDTFNLFFANIYYLYDLVRDSEKKKKVNKICFYLECHRKEFKQQKNITYAEIDKILDVIKFDKKKIEDVVSDSCITNSTAYNTNMYYEMNFIFVFLEKIIEDNALNYKEIIYSLKFNDLVSGEEKHKKVVNKFVARNSILYLLYPEEFEPILSYSDKEKIVTFYKGSIIKDDYEQLDKDLFEIRESLIWMDSNSGSFYAEREDNTWKDITISHCSKKRKKIVNTRQDIQSKDLCTIADGDEKEAIIKSRIGQSKFRENLLNKYQQCCICEIKNNSLLIANHIKPWSECANGQEKTDYEFNGLLLCPQHDKLFDKGYISFDDSGKIKISNLLDEKEYQLFNINSNSKLNISIMPKMKLYLKYHSEIKFK
ncbi:MAG: HNH endonuclease signature motif containing protein [Campylobacterales bacterium]|nr:HNH endonuclease signature motif containing protein [Campylobacterales bacterium]